VGRALLRTACDLFARPEIEDASRRMAYGHHPVVFGLVAHALGIPADTAAATYAFQSMRGQVSAAQRLTRLGQSEAQRLLHQIKPEIEQAVSIALEYPLEQAVPFVPLLEVASMAHERSEVRLFVS
jgi:urease accessory protein